MPQQQTSDSLVTLAAVYQAQTAALRARVARFVRALWRSYPIHDDAAMAAYVASVGPVITGAQLQMASLTTAFLAHQRQLALGTLLAPVAIDPKLVSGPATRGGVPLDVVNARPFHVTWKALHDLPREPDSIDKAVKAGEQRALSIAATYVQLAKTHAQQEVTAKDRRVAYTRRILEGPSSCGLCIVASTQRYHASDLMPIHPGCDCSQEVVYDDQDPGRIIDLNTLQDVHARLEQRFGASSPSADVIASDDAHDIAASYRDALLVHDHGEIGPVLAVRDQHFTGPAEIAAA